MIAPALTFWWHLFATLSVEVCGLAALGFAAQWLARSAFWRRAAWQIIVVCLLAAAVSEWTGVGRALAQHFAPRRQVVEIKPTSNIANIGPAPRWNPVIVQQFAALPPSPPPEKPPRAVWWPGLVGLAGTILLLARTAMGQGILFALRFGRNKITDGPLRERLARLAPRLGLRRKVSLRRMSALVSPMAFGIFRPCIGLPAQFETRFTPAEQDAVLAHELAHLAARDPLWFLLADLAVAALWWHPAAWWARQRLHILSEQAADEATAFVPDGPKALAQCLVALGKEMADMRAWGWVGINGGGFRSSLGRRVEGLLQLSSGPPPLAIGRGARAAKIAAMLAATPLTVLAFGSMQATQGPSDETWPSQLAQSWHQSPAGVLLLAKRDDQAKPPATNRVEDATPPRETAKDAPSAARLKEATQIQNAKFLYEMGKFDEAEKICIQVLKEYPSNRTPPYYLDLIKEARYHGDSKGQGLFKPKPMLGTNLVYTTKGRMRILSLLKAIMFDEVSYDLPLKEVLVRLRVESQKRDPDGIGINFMINQGFAVDQDIASAVIRISHPLKNLSLLDVLDAITKVADKPIRYSIEDYAVVFSPKETGQNAKYLYEMGKYDEAETIFKRVLEDDPRDRSSLYYLDLIKEARYMIQARRREEAVKSGLRAVNDINMGSTTNKRARIMTKLYNIKFNEVSYNAPLKDVLLLVRTESQKRDPDGVGIHFMINQNVDVSSTNGTSVVPIDQDILSEVIRISPPLKNLRLIDVLDEITRVSPKPIRYTIEDYAVVFSPKPVETASLVMHRFRVNPNTFLQGLEKVSPAVNAAGSKSTNADGGTTNSTMEANSMLRSYLTAAGVDLTPPKMIFFNDRLGELLVRATASDLEIIQHVVETLNRTPPQVMLETKYVELPPEQTRVLGFDWALGNTLGTVTVNWTPPQSHVAIYDRLGYPLRVFNWPDSPSRFTIQDHESQARAEVMSATQFRTAINAIKQQTGTDILSLTRVTTESGRQAHMPAQNSQYIVSEASVTETTGAGGGGLTNATVAAALSTNYTTSYIPFGPSLDVIPTVEADGFTIQISANAHILTSNQLYQTTASLRVWDGQTMVFGGVMTNQPPGEAQKKVMLFFVTPRIIDPAGNAVHTDEELDSSMEKVRH